MVVARACAYAVYALSVFFRSNKAEKLAARARASAINANFGGKTKPRNPLG